MSARNFIYQANDSTNDTSSDKSHDGLSVTLFLLRNGPFWPLVDQAWREYTEKLVLPVHDPEHKSAVHIELVHSLDIDDFIMCFRRLINRRCKVVQLIIRSDKRYQYCAWRKRAERKSHTVEPATRLSANGFSEDANGVFSHLLLRFIVLKSIMGTQIVTEAEFCRRC